MLYVADQDGGTHVDPKIGEDYAKLSRQNSMGRLYKKGAEEWKPVENPHLVTVRQIAHEVLKTLKPGYTKFRTEEKGLIIGGFHLFNKAETPASGKSKVGRNNPCPCGSGKKYKKCCGN